MRTIDELGISPAPWSLWHCSSSYPHLINCGNEYEFVKGVDEAEITAWPLRKNRKVNLANARLIAAAPELYECLREAIVQTCLYCKYKKCQECKVVNKWKSVISKAGVEEVAK